MKELLVLPDRLTVFIAGDDSAACGAIESVLTLSFFEDCRLLGPFTFCAYKFLPHSLLKEQRANHLQFPLNA